MTNDRRKQARAVLLAVLMVGSVFGGTIAFAGGAAAAATDISGTQSSDIVVDDDQAQQDIQFNVTVEDSTSETVIVNTSALRDAGAEVSSISNRNVSQNQSDDGSSSIELGNNNNVEITLPDEGQVNGGTEFDVRFEIEYDTSGVETTSGDSLSFPVQTLNATGSANGSVSFDAVDDVASAGSPTDLPIGDSIDQSIETIDLNTGGNEDGFVYVNVTGVENYNVDTDSLSAGDITAVGDDTAGESTKTVNTNNQATVFYFSVEDANSDGSVTIDTANLTAFDTSGAQSADLDYEVAMTMGATPDSSLNAAGDAPDNAPNADDFSTTSFAIGDTVDDSSASVTATPNVAGENANHTVKTFVTSGNLVNGLEVAYPSGTPTTNVSNVTASDLSLSISGESVAIDSISKPDDNTLVVRFPQHTADSAKSITLTSENHPFQNPDTESETTVDVNVLSGDTTVDDLNTDPTLSVVSPAVIQDASVEVVAETTSDGLIQGGENLNVSATVTGLEGDAGEEVTADLSDFGANENEVLDNTNGPDTTFHWNETVTAGNLPEDGTYTITVTATEDSGSTDTAETNAIEVDDVVTRTLTVSPKEGNSNANYGVTFESDRTQSTLVNGLEVDLSRLGANATNVTAANLDVTHNGDSRSITDVSTSNDNQTLTVTFDAVEVGNTDVVKLTSTDREFVNGGTIEDSADVDLLSGGSSVESGTTNTVDIQADTKPYVQNVIVENAPINDSDAGTEQTVTVVFDQLMDTSVAPSVNVTGLNTDPIEVSGSYDNVTTWQGTVTIPDENEENLATVDVKNAKDDEGNSLVAPTTANFDVDTKEPTVSVNEAYTDDVLVSGDLDLSNDVFSVSGENTVTYDYTVDGETWNTSEIDAGVLNTSNLSDGTVTLRVTASDDAQNTNSTTTTVVVDNTAPSGLDIVVPGSQVELASDDALDLGYEYNESNPATVKVLVGDAADPAVSFDVNDSQYVDDGTLKTITIAEVGDGNDLTDGTYNLTVRALDAAGNEMDSDTFEDGILINDVAPTLNVGNEIADTKPAKNVTVDYDYSDENGANATLTFKVIADNGNVLRTETLEDVESGTDTTEEVQLPDSEGTFNVTVTAENDLDGDTTVAATNDFEVAADPVEDTDAPYIEHIEAATGNDDVVVTFSEGISQESLDASDFSYQDRSADGASAVERVIWTDDAQVKLELNEPVSASDLTESADLIGAREDQISDTSNNWMSTDGVALQDTEAPAEPKFDIGHIVHLGNQNSYPVALDLANVEETVDVTVTLSDGEETASTTVESVAPSTDPVVSVDASALADGEIDVQATLSDHAPTTHTSTNSTVVSKHTELLSGIDAQEGSDTVLIEFATPVTDANGDALTAANFTYTDANDANASGVASVEHSAGDAVATVTLNASASATDIGNDTLGIAADEVRDVFGGLADAESATLGDNLAPSVEDFDVTANDTSGEVTVTAVTDEALDTLNVTLDTAEELPSETETSTEPGAELVRSDFSENASDGTYTYTATYDAPRDGQYEADLMTFADAAGNGYESAHDIAWIDSSDTLDTSAPSVDNAFISDTNGAATLVEVRFSEPIRNWNVALDTDDVSVENGDVEDAAFGLNTAEITLDGQLSTDDAPNVTIDGTAYSEEYGDATNGMGNTTAVHTTHLTLKEGQNFVSVPAETGSVGIDELDTSSVDSIWTYDDGEWMVNIPGTGVEDFTSLHGGQGYVVVADSETTVDVNVQNTLDTTGGTPTLPGQTQLEEGWNLVGHWQEGGQNSEDALGSIWSDVHDVYGQNGNQFESIEDNEILEPGEAYWTFVTDDTVYGPADWNAA